LPHVESGGFNRTIEHPCYRRGSVIRDGVAIDEMMGSALASVLWRSTSFASFTYIEKETTMLQFENGSGKFKSFEGEKFEGILKMLDEVEYGAKYLSERQKFDEIVEFMCADDDGDCCNSTGEFGSITNPIPCKTIFGAKSYINRLRQENGCRIRCTRVKSVYDPVSKRPVEEYEIADKSGQPLVKLYISPYHKFNSVVAPCGFTLRNYEWSAHYEYADILLSEVDADEFVMEMPTGSNAGG
jgi:hypothetical protein